MANQNIDAFNMAGGPEHKLNEGDDVERFINRMQAIIDAQGITAARQIPAIKLCCSDRIRESIEKFINDWPAAHPGGPNVPTVPDIYQFLRDTYPISTAEKKTTHQILSGIKQQDYQTVDSYYKTFEETRRRSLETPDFIAIEYFIRGLNPDLKYYVTIHNNPARTVREVYLHAKDFENKIINAVLPKAPLSNAKDIIESTVTSTIQKLYPQAVQTSVTPKIKSVIPTVKLNSNQSTIDDEDNMVDDDLLTEGLITAMMTNKSFINKVAQAATNQMKRRNHNNIGFVNSNNGNNNYSNSNKKNKNGNSNGGKNKNSFNNDSDRPYCDYCKQYGHKSIFCAKKQKALSEQLVKVLEELDELKKSKSNNNNKTNSNSNSF